MSFVRPGTPTLGVIIRPARDTEAELLSSLAMTAKAHWGYSTEMLECWRAALTLSPRDIRTRPTFVALVGEQIAGFCALSPSDGPWELDHLWVAPQFMRQGVGRDLLSHALEVAARCGAVEVTIDADPNAERFYLARGAVRRGLLPAPIPGQPGRVRPQLAFNVRAGTLRPPPERT